MAATALPGGDMVRTRHVYEAHHEPAACLDLGTYTLSFPAASGVRDLPTVLIVDHADLNRRLLRGILKSEPYRVLEARRAAEALALLACERVDLLIVDFNMSGLDGAEFCRTLKANPRTRLIPVLMTTGVVGSDSEVAGIDSGADEFLIRPFHPAVVRARVRAMLRTKAITDSLEAAESIVFALAQAVEHRDAYTAGHCERLARYSVALGAALGLHQSDLLALYRGGFLHDIGKIGIPDAILHKPGPLTDDEWALMKRHTVRGEEICRGMRSLASVLPIIRSHHEKWDGSGYPDGLAGEDIPLTARILQVADIYDALTTQRSYKPPYSPEEAIRILEAEAARGWRDPLLVSTFARVRAEGRLDSTLPICVPPVPWAESLPALTNQDPGFAD